MGLHVAVAEPLVLPEQPLTSQLLFAEYAPFVWRVLRRLGVREADIEDVCQEVFVAVHKQLPSFEGRSKPSTWIYAIAMRRAASYRKRAQHHREQLVAEPSDAPVDAGAAESGGEELQRREMRAQLDRLLDALDDDKRAVFVLYEIEELAMREIAQIVGCPLQTAYNRLYAARALLKRAAQDAGITP
jgi:RNA polymerase sigma-70 factor (ECF subfamily)